MGYGVIEVGTGATLIIADNSKRKILTLTNASEAAPVWIGPDASITTLNAASILYETQTRNNAKDFGYWLGPVYGITNDGGSVARVYYWEVESNL